MFGLELPTSVNFVIAFAFVLLLIGAAAWLVRRFGATKIDPAARGRQPRLAVIDSAAVDGRRKLVIIRRDNVEHLLMIGGPTDVVVETNLVRGTVPATRDAPVAAARNGNGEFGSRGLSSSDPTAWPLQPEAAPAPVQPLVRSMPRLSADDVWDTPIEPAAPPAPAPEVRAPRPAPADPLTGLADDLARPSEPNTIRAVQIQPSRAIAQPVAATNTMQHNPAADQSLAEMAQRLEAALRRPNAQKVTTETQRITATLEVKALPQKAAAGARGGAQPRPQGNLEQEMASLLSRPGKT